MTPEIPPVSLPPDMVRLIQQNGLETDCVVAALASLCGLTYTQSLVYCASVNPDVLTKGMNWTDTQKAAKLAGVKTRIVRSSRVDVSETTGILSVAHQKKSDHAVFLWAGRIVDGNGEHWLEPDVYCRAYGYKPTSILVRVDE